MLWAFLLIITVFLFVLLNAFILPKIFLGFDQSYLKPCDRGFRRYKETNGHTMVYEPDTKIRSYIHQYIISERNRKKFFIAKLNDKLGFIDFDVTVYNSDGKAVKVLNIKEIIKNKGYTEIRDLPADTAFVSLSLNAADNNIFKDRQVAKAKLIRVCICLLLSVFLDVFCIIAIKVFSARLFGGLYGESFIILGKTWGATCGLCAIVVLIHSLFIFAYAYFKNLTDLISLKVNIKKFIKFKQDVKPAVKEEPAKEVLSEDVEAGELQVMDKINTEEADKNQQTEKLTANEEITKRKPFAGIFGKIKDKSTELLNTVKSVVKKDKNGTDDAQEKEVVNDAQIKFAQDKDIESEQPVKDESNVLQDSDVEKSNYGRSEELPAEDKNAAHEIENSEDGSQQNALDSEEAENGGKVDEPNDTVVGEKAVTQIKEDEKGGNKLKAKLGGLIGGIKSKLKRKGGDE